MNWYKTIISQKLSLLHELIRLKPQIIKKVQEIYDLWEQDDEGIDVEYGCGGICDKISQTVSDIMAWSIDDVEVFPGGQEGDDHAWVIVKKNDEAYAVDIPPGYYETGGGYCWRKIPNVEFTENMIDIFPLDAKEVEPLNELV